MNLKEIGEKRQKKWKETDIYNVKEDPKKKKMFVPPQFPYPSGEGLHAGHTKVYTAADVIGRKKLLQNFSVLTPMGWDAFGLPAENYAMKHKVHPSVAVSKNVEIFKKQLGQLGCAIDRDREINTTDPEYYKWTQRIFLKLYNHYYDEKLDKAMPITDPTTQQRLAYVDYKPINRCPTCKTGLANEDLEGGKCERCESDVEQKPMRQRVLRITKYADRLISGLDKLDREPGVKELEKNRIGKSEGTQFKMVIASETKQSPTDELSFGIYTTRVDTVFGMSFVAIAPEHILVDQITTDEYKSQVEEYKAKAKNKTQMERTELNKDKTGIFSGSYAINPFNGEKVAIFVTDYVLANYGTGVVMAVPAHDERDFEFAQKYNLPITNSILPTDKNIENYDQITKCEICYPDKGILNNSGEFTGMTSDEAIAAMQKWLEKKGIGGKKYMYKLQERVFSRQRYRGEPIPMIHCPHCGVVPLQESDLPLTLPQLEHYEPTGTEEGPLSTIESWINVKCPTCGEAAKRESNTMPNRAGSSRYWLRYMDNHNNKELVSHEKEKYRKEVDYYIGGPEHITRHMIYARFWHKFLFDIGVVSFDEPFQRFERVGIVLGEDGRKMSKRLGNGINPIEIVNQFGADALRLYQMFVGPFGQDIAFKVEGVKGIQRFLEKIINLNEKTSDIDNNQDTTILLNQTIKKLTEDIDGFKFNTAISQLMILVNHLTEIVSVNKKTYETLVILVAPFAPHLAEEIRETLGNTYSIFTTASRPIYDEKNLVSDTVKIGVQFNGKVRGDIQISKEATQEEVMNIVKADPKLSARLTAEPKKVIYIQGKILNIVI